PFAPSVAVLLCFTRRPSRRACNCKDFVRVFRSRSSGARGKPSGEPPPSGGRMNRFLIAVAFLIAASSAAFAQSDPVFDENTVATYRITMNPAEWDMIVNDPAGTGVTWKRCTFEWQGETVADVAIRASRTYNPRSEEHTSAL